MSQNMINISAIDGRYAKKTVALQDYFSEFALFKYRLHIEVEYFIFLAQTIEQLSLSDDQISRLRKIVTNFDVQEAQKIKTIEQITNHDVKAVEYYLKEQFDQIKLSKHKEFVHFALTSQDINNTAFPLMLKDAQHHVLLNEIETLTNNLEQKTEEWKDIAMLAHTHGQPASPTRLGKEVYVFVARLKKQIKLLHDFEFEGKFGGATGNFNAHKVAFNQINWPKQASIFLASMGLKRQEITTQIEHYDSLAEYFQIWMRISTILIDLSRDFWTYISMNYFKQKIKQGEVGSSAMPHKVNPIDFENAEGNLGIARALLAHLSDKLPVSRLQRDLTDSTVLRNIGVPYGHIVIACKALVKGLDKLLVQEHQITKDLKSNQIVLAEAIQNILRREGVENAYEQLKALTRKNENIAKEDLKIFIEQLNVEQHIKEELFKLDATNYTGYSLDALKNS